MGTKGIVLAGMVLAACATPADDAPRARHDKPGAPVRLELRERAFGGGVHEVTLVATPTRDVRDLALTLDGETRQVARASAGEAQTLTVRRTAGAVGRELIAGARVEGRSRAATLALGHVPAAPALPTRTIRLGNGVVVEEVRP